MAKPKPNLGDMLNGKKRVVKKDIDVNYRIVENIASNQPEKETVLAGWEEFVCKACNRSYGRIPLKGVCDCGGEMLISFRGSLGKKVVINES